MSDSTAPDPFGRALLDHYRGERERPLRQRDGEHVLEHPIEEFYFASSDEVPQFLDDWLEAPLVDLGAGAGRDTLAFQHRRDADVVAVEVSDPLVKLLRERGVERVRNADMFALRTTFEPDRFRSALALGTQVGLAKSLGGLSAFLEGLAHITTDDATAVIDAYDPSFEGATDMLGFRADERDGLGFRVVAYEYEGELGEALLFLLFSPDRLREAADGTPWHVAAVDRPHGAYHYRAALSKRPRDG